MLIEVRLRPPRMRLQVGRWHFRTWPAFVMSTPRGYVEPFAVYVVESADESGDACLGQVGAFVSENEARKLLARLESEGQPVRLNIVHVHERWRDYEHDR